MLFPSTVGRIHFKPLRREDFPCYDLALYSLEKGDNYPCALNGGGEVAVHAFLRGELPFLAIADAIAYAMEKTERAKPDSYKILQETDGAARAYAREYIQKNYAK